MAEAIPTASASKEMRIAEGSEVELGMATSRRARVPKKAKMEQRRTTARTLTRLGRDLGRCGRERTEEPHCRQYLAEAGFT